MVKRAARVGLPDLALDPRGRRPLHQQLYDRLRGAVLEGALAAGARLPSTRLLAEQLGVSRTTVLAAYRQLVAEGYLEGRVGAGTRVAALLPDGLLSVGRSAVARRGGTRAPTGRAVARRATLLTQDRFGTELRLAGRGWRTAFRLAVPALDAAPLALWARLLARQARQAVREDLDYQDSRGLPPLRRAIAQHLALARGMVCDPGQVLVTAGAQSAMDLAVRVLLDPGDRALVEDPGHLGIRGALRGAGAEVVGQPVDGEGLRLEARAASAARLACVTPSNQFPLTVTMSLPRRLALLRWAEGQGSWILEDDYDSEFRFAGRPLEALAALDRSARVVYVGSFSKVLFPGLRLGYLVVPPDLVEVFAAAKRFVDVHPPPLLQATLADFIESGHFARHLRSMRVLYRERAALLAEALEKRLGGVLRVRRPDAGLHLVAFLPAGLDDRAVSTAAAALGVEARPLSAYALRTGEPGLVLGYGTARRREVTQAVERLARAIEAARNASPAYPRR